MAHTEINGILETDSSGGSVVVTNDGTFATPANQVSEIAQLTTIAGKDFATQTTLALIKAKTDNIDVALSTRTKPADQQHVIVDSGSSTISGTVTANQGTAGATSWKVVEDNSAAIKSDLDTLVISNAPGTVSGAGLYVRQDSTATIAKETGGNLATLAAVVYTKGGVILDGAPTYSQASDNGTPVTTSTTTDLVAAPSAGNHLEIYRLHVTNSSTTAVLIQFIDSTPSNKFYTCYLPQYGIMSIDLRGGWHLASAKKLQMITTGTGSIYWHVDYKTAAD